ncbi:MAG: hypothetical protein BJG00_016840 [Limnothrix sp. CACIAM 69d]|nr:MAG: hypothetical protein BJG00_016840 [Limnothrix sp. CACIAM 69d]
MGSSNSKFDQDQQIQNSNISGQVSQAGRDAIQLQINIQNSPDQQKAFLHHNLSKISLRERPIQFLTIFLFILKVLFYWLFIWWKVQHKLPINLVWYLLKKICSGELDEAIVQLQASNDQEINSFIENKNKFSLDEKIALEAKIELCLDLIRSMASGQPEKKDKIAEFLASNLSKSTWFSEEIRSEKRSSHQKLYDIQEAAKKSNKLKASYIIEKYLDSLIEFLDKCHSDPDISYALVDITTAFIEIHKSKVPIHELIFLKRFEQLFNKIFDKSIADPFNVNYALQNRFRELRDDHNSLLKSLEYQSILNHEFQNKNQELTEQLQLASQENQDLNTVIKRQQEIIIKKETEANLIAKDPARFLGDHWKIQYIAKNKGEKYHYSTKCPYWRSLVFDYICAKVYEPNKSSDFILASSAHSFKSGVSECQRCRANSMK